jgi:transcription antitermination factor NusG
MIPADVSFCWTPPKLLFLGCIHMDLGQGYRSAEMGIAYPPPCLPRMNTGELRPRWYVACTLARHEKAIADRLRSKEIETYLPLYWAVRSWGQRRAKVELPLFPGYVFVRTEITRKVRVLEHPGVIRFVGLNGKATPIADEDMQTLRTSLSACKAEPYPYLIAGRRIRIKSGPLLGVEGAIVRRKGSVRLIVQVDLIQRAVLLELDAVDAQLTT